MTFKLFQMYPCGLARMVMVTDASNSVNFRQAHRGFARIEVTDSVFALVCSFSKSYRSFKNCNIIEQGRYEK